jgi:hypothetical protein
MGNLVKVLVSLAALAFVLAVVTHFTGPVLVDTLPEAYSRAATNLALLAIAVAVGFGDRVSAGRLP